MKTAKNGKSSFENLATVIDKLEEDQFAEILEKTKDKTKIFLGLLRQRLAKNPIDIVSEHDFPEVKTKNFSKLIENSYARVLTLLAEIWKKDEAKKWQKDIERRIDEIEGLCFIQLYEQAAVQLANLEEYLFSNGLKSKIQRFYDDWVLISRIVNLKFHLVRFGDGILKNDSWDTVIHSCFMAAYNLRREHEHSEWSLMESRAVYHNFIAYNLLSTNKLNQFIQIKNNQLKEVQSLDKDEMKSLSQIIYWEMALAYYRNGQYTETEKILRELNRDLNMPSLIIRQQFFELLLKIKIETNELHEWGELKNLYESYHYNEAKIRDLNIRLELNQLLIKFLEGLYEDCIDRIKDLKQSQKQRLGDNLSVYRDLLFLELISEYLNLSFSNRDTIIRTLKKLCEDDTFEFQARKILMEITKYRADFQQRPFAEENPKKFDSLKSLSKNGEPMHALILSFLKGNFRPAKTSIF